MTRILAFLIQDFPPTGMIYGAERSFIDLAENLTKLGGQVHFIELFPSLVRLSGSNLSYTEAKRGSLYLIRTTYQAIRSVKQLKSEAVFAYHSDHFSSVIPAFFTSLATGKPFFLGALDDRLEPEDKLSYRASFSKSLRSEKNLKRSLWKLGLTLLRRVACARAICLASTEHVAKYARSCLHSRNVFVIGRGVNSSWFDTSDEQENGRTFDACYLGRIDPMKGIGTLFKAWKQITGKRPDAKLLMVGEAWPGLLQGYLDQIKELQISDRVVFAGYISEVPKLRNLLQSSRIFVFPSKIEGFPRAVIEAMACGLPCVLGDIPTMREIFGEAAIFVPTDDYISLASAITGLLGDEQMRKEMAQKSMLLAKSYLWPKVAARTLSVINSTINSKER